MIAPTENEIPLPSQFSYPVFQTFLNQTSMPAYKLPFPVFFGSITAFVLACTTPLFFERQIANRIRPQGMVSPIRTTLLLVPVIDAPVWYQRFMHKKPNLPRKLCQHCGLPFVWRKQWRAVWEQVRYCSERCRREHKRVHGERHTG